MGIKQHSDLELLLGAFLFMPFLLWVPFSPQNPAPKGPPHHMVYDVLEATWMTSLSDEEASHA